MNKDLKITVVYGGISTEREVALRSGAAVAEALTGYGYENVTLFDLKRDNLGELLQSKPDICFLALHGVGGEDGTIQGALQLAGIPYTGAGVAASAVCMDKVLSKTVLKANNIPTADYVVANKRDCADRAALAEQLIDRLGLPMVVKAPCQGSSIGVVIVHKAEDMAAAIEEIFSYGEQLLAEEFLDGTELTLPIFGNDSLTVLPVIEITSEHEFFDYVAKYTNGLCRHIIPARISEEEQQAVCALGEQTYRALGCTGMGRVDIIIDRKKGPMVIELNTLPGMTAMSLFPDSARSVGISFGELCSKLIELGLEAVR